MTAIVVGGSSGLGRALCVALAKRGDDVVIVAGNAADCERLASHLELLHGVKAVPLAVDARNPQTFAAALVDVAERIGHVTGLFLPIGLAVDDDIHGTAGQRMKDIWAVNYDAVVHAIEAIQPRMEPGGRIVGFGSIAAARARNRNLQYASAKAALATYFEGLRHALSDGPQTVQFYVVGYVESGQSFGKTQLFPALPADKAAAIVLRDGNRDFGRRYLPRWWAIVATMLRLLPWRVFSRLKT